MVNSAVALVMAPATLLFSLTLEFFVHPLWMFEDWNAFGLFAAFYAVPWCLAGILLYAAATAGEQTDKLRGLE
ncbi:hypothetical protein U1839_19605 [Sphingomonas sp. RT2P30]